MTITSAKEVSQPKASGANGKKDYVSEMYSAISRGDIPGLRDCLSPNVRVWHNYDGCELDIDKVCETLTYFCAISTSRSYEQQRITRVDGLLFVQHTLTASLKSGQTLSLPVMKRIELDGDGRVARIEEYFDSRGLDVLGTA